MEAPELGFRQTQARRVLALDPRRVPRVEGVPDVVAVFTFTVAEFGLPVATVTDNRSVYASRLTHSHKGFERLLASLGITRQKGHLGQRQNQGKSNASTNAQASARRPDPARHPC